MEAKEISKAVIKRLPRYYRYLGELMEENVERISSNDLSLSMSIIPICYFIVKLNLYFLTKYFCIFLSISF